jgi:tRNA A-37 threonylcarbamoyl transferase component Bud32
MDAEEKGNYELAKKEIKKAGNYIKTDEVEQKLKIYDNEIAKKNWQRVFFLINAAIILIIILSIIRNRQRVELIAKLPPLISELIANSKYEEAFKNYEKYRDIGGNPANFSREELFTIFDAVGKTLELVEENIPNQYLLHYAVALAKAGKLKEAMIMLKNGELIRSLRNPAEIEEVADIYVIMKKERELPKLIVEMELRPDFFTQIANKFYKEKRYELSISILESKIEMGNERYVLSDSDWKLYFNLYAAVDKVHEINPEKVPPQYRTLIIEAMMKKGNLKQAKRVLAEIPKETWEFEEYKIAMKLYILMDMYEFAEEIFNEIKAENTLKQAPEIYYEFARFCEDAGKLKPALDMYKEFIRQNIIYEDVEERYVKVRDLIESGEADMQKAKIKMAGGKTVAIDKEKGDEQAIGGKYVMVKLIGEGGMGQVFEGYDIKMKNKKVAIKQMKAELRIDPVAKQNFLREANSVAVLHHPNIVDIYSIEEQGDNIYLIFEFVEGLTLEKHLQKYGKLSIRSSFKLLLQVLAALEYAHENRIMHLDLKPSNIMYNERYAKVMDFGIARRVKDTIASTMGQSISVIAGTLAYMSPEQHRGKGVDERSDIYSLGITMYEAVAGVKPYPGIDYYTQKIGKMHTPLLEIVPEIPKEYEALIMKCMEPDKEARYQSVKEILKDVENLKLETT